MPADPRTAPSVTAILARFPVLEATRGRARLAERLGPWRGLVSVTARDGKGFFAVRSMSGEPPEELPEPTEDGPLVLLPLDRAGAELVDALEGTQLDDLARRASARSATAARPRPPSSTSTSTTTNEPQFVLFTVWDPRPCASFRKLPESRFKERHGRFFDRERARGSSRCPRTRRWSSRSRRSSRPTRRWRSTTKAREQLDELRIEHARAAATVALSYAEDAELDDLELGGELHPFQRAGVRYALERRRTFIADEQGLGKTVQALATLEADDAFPAVVVCPASMKLIWERESHIWLPGPQGRAARRPRRRSRWPEARRPRSSS